MAEPELPQTAEAPRANLAVTALYTCHTWVDAGFTGAELLASPQSRGVFKWTNRIYGLARFFRPDAPSLQHSLVQRHQTLNAVAQAAGNPQVLELAAGLSPRGAAMSADPATRYVEVDLEPVVRFKRKRLETTEQGRAVLARPNLELVVGDVATIDLSALIDPSKPVTVIAEGLLMYLTAKEQQALFARLHSVISHHPDSLLTFDLTPPAEQPAQGALGRMLGGLMRIFTRGRGFVRDDRTREDLRRQLSDVGLTQVVLHDPNSPPPAITLMHRKELTQFLVWVCRWANHSSAPTEADEDG